MRPHRRLLDGVPGAIRAVHFRCQPLKPPPTRPSARRSLPRWATCRFKLWMFRATIPVPVAI